LAESTPKLTLSSFLRIDRNLGRSPEAYGTLLFNILVLIMLLVFPEDRYIVIAAYFLETLVIGIFNVIKMAIVALFSPADNEAPKVMNSLRQNKNSSPRGGSNLFLIVFFIMHFSIFYFVQLGILIGTADTMDRSFPGGDSFIPDPLVFFRAALGEEGKYILLAILVTQLFALVYSFIFKGEYRMMNCLTQGMQPYGRIFMQQFVVLLGGFVIIIFQNAVVFSVLLIIFKTFIDAWSQNKHNVRMLMKLAERPAEDQ
jgi:hypothetical protein